MFGIGFGELIIIAIVLILAVGPDRLPTLMKTVGKTIRQVRDTSRDLRASIGLDDLMREDYLRDRPKPLRPLPSPNGQVARPPNAGDDPGDAGDATTGSGDEQTSGSQTSGSQTSGSQTSGSAAAVHPIAAQISAAGAPATAKPEVIPDPTAANAVPRPLGAEKREVTAETRSPASGASSAVPKNER